jgi:flagellar biosynthesis chaperone FliJ
MPKHEHYQEICAAATIGQATGEELAELNEHLTVCQECRHRYSDFMEIQASQYASRTDDLQIAGAEALGCIDSPLLRKRFMERAESEGITFSQVDAEQPETAPSLRFRPAAWSSWFAMQVAMALLLVSFGILLGRYIANIRTQRVYVSDFRPNAQAAVSTDNSKGLIAKVSGLEKQNQELTADLNTARANFEHASSRITELEASNAKSGQDRVRLGSIIQDGNEVIANLEQQLSETKSSVAELQANLDKTRATTTENQTALIEARIRVQELTEQLAEESKSLDRQKELFAAGRDIRELMAARNLHIVDVFDTDPKGKTRPAFGRIFLTEGKSLIFYAYDLSDIRVQDAGYHYRVWGKREGQNQRARSLGIFYSDDKSQKRWVFQYDDPKVLKEIDSVFVTLEPPNTNLNQPKGDKLLYAYLKGQANHP